jgi:hypothetical protein
MSNARIEARWTKDDCGYTVLDLTEPGRTWTAAEVAAVEVAGDPRLGCGDKTRNPVRLEDGGRVLRFGGMWHGFALGLMDAALTRDPLECAEAWGILDAVG